MIPKEWRGVEIPQYNLDVWKPSDVSSIARLEKACWAPWLRRPEQHIATIAEKFPQTQLLVRNQQGTILAAMTANRINWDGKPTSLPTWDTVARGSEAASDYTQTYTPNGNTLCLLSSAIDPTVQGKRLAPQLIEGMKAVAKELRVDHLIGPFRPSGYGEYKLEHGLIDFSKYCNMTREDGQLLDPWLRSAVRLEMKPLRIEERSMVVEVPRSTFEEYRETYYLQKWKQIEPGQWECGETGSWFVRGDHAVYIEPNIWGELPI